MKAAGATDACLLFCIGEAARHLGVTPRTLRHREEMGLVATSAQAHARGRHEDWATRAREALRVYLCTGHY